LNITATYTLNKDKIHDSADAEARTSTAKVHVKMKALGGGQGFANNGTTFTGRMQGPVGARLPGPN
jgi:hypothetical protein